MAAVTALMLVSLPSSSQVVPTFTAANASASASCAQDPYDPALWHPNESAYADATFVAAAVGATAHAQALTDHYGGDAVSWLNGHAHGGQAVAQAGGGSADAAFLEKVEATARGEVFWVVPAEDADREVDWCIPDANQPSLDIGEYDGVTCYQQREDLEPFSLLGVGVLWRYEDSGGVLFFLRVPDEEDIGLHTTYVWEGSFGFTNDADDWTIHPGAIPPDAVALRPIELAITDKGCSVLKHRQVSLP